VMTDADDYPYRESSGFPALMGVKG